jgi:hypothetical protein
MFRIVFITLFLWGCAAGAQDIYRWENKDGSVTLFRPAATPSVDAGRIEREQLPDLYSVPTKEVSSLPSELEPKQGDEATEPYEQFSMLQPQDNAAVRANEGNVTITLDLRPALWTCGRSQRLPLPG